MTYEKGHKPHPDCSKGGVYGHLGKPKDAYTEEELIQLGQELIDYMNEPKSLWANGFCRRKGIRISHLNYLIGKYPIFAEYYEFAKEIQQEKLIVEPFWKKADGNHARFVLACAHKGIWETKVEAAGTEQQASDLSKALDTIQFLQDHLARNMDDKSKSTDTKS